MDGDKILDLPFVLQNGYGDPIHGELRVRADAGHVPVIVICHSFMAFKDWGFFPYVAIALAQAGFGAVTFNFSFNGVVGERKRITDFEKFERNTFTREFHDLGRVIDAIADHQIGDGNIDASNVALLGHSRGGGIAIVQAAGDDRVRALATWSAISKFDRWTEHQKELWRASGYLPLSKNTSVSPLKIGLGLLRDLEEHQEQYDISRAARSIQVPWLILHGREDMIVRFMEAEMLYEHSDSAFTELRLFGHVGHLYNAASKKEDHYKTLDEVLDTTIQWFKRQFAKE